MESKQITNCILAESAVHTEMCGLDHEEVWILFLTKANTIICKEMVSMGTLDQTSIDARTILRRVLLNNAGNIIMAHNHPSGNPNPSKQDIEFTHKLKEACDIMEIGLIDHIIVSGRKFYSFACEKVLTT